MLLSCQELSYTYGLKRLLDRVTFCLNPGDKLGIIGINGTGKSTLLRLVAGTLPADHGSVTSDPNVQIAYLPQNPDMEPNNTVLEQVFASFPAEFRALKEYEAKTMLTRLGVTCFDQPVGTLSGGQRKRIALAATLIHPADLLILDEPTNHLDAEMVAWLEGQLMRFNGGILMVTHDRYFLERVTNQIAELSHGQLIFYEANYSHYLELKAQREELAEAAERKRQNLLRREYAWISRGCRARTTKSKDRIERYEALKAQTGPEHDDTVSMGAAASRLGRKTIELRHVSKHYGAHCVLQDFSYLIRRGDRIGIVGHNGAGKSTLLNLIAGRLTPDSGEIETGTTVKVGYFTQEGLELDPEQNIYDYICEIASSIVTDEGVCTASQMLERFLFDRHTHHIAIGRLSGGERRRLYLLGILMSAPNVLLLDEPTNDLDITTLCILEEYLEHFAGPVIAVSHDRYFLDKLADTIFAFDEEGRVVEYTGNYSDYLDKRPVKKLEKKAAAAPKEAPAAPRPQKLKFSFREQREFDTIDDDIAALEEQIAQADEAIAASGADYVALEQAMAEKERLQQQLDEKMERWVYLTDLAERIEAQRK